MSKYYYAVKKGLVPGVYRTWDQCKEQVHGFPGSIYKKFGTLEEAKEFMSFENSEKPISELVKDEDVVVAYVDGSYNLEDGTYSYGVIIIDRDKEHRFSGRDKNKDMAAMRNVAGELKGAVVAMDWAIKNNKKTLYLHYDYTGIENWAKGNWKTNKEGTKDYKKYYDGIKSKLDVKFIKVKAHSGNKLNDEADRLAKEAIL